MPGEGIELHYKDVHLYASRLVVNAAELQVQTVNGPVNLANEVRPCCWVAIVRDL